MVHNKRDWVIACASVPGRAHLEHDIPCQDHARVLTLGGGWGLAVVCDGAGSASHSDKGAAFVSDYVVTQLKIKIEALAWPVQGHLPSAEHWTEVSTTVFAEARDALMAYAAAQNIPYTAFACTVILVVYTPGGLLVAHIGDGRAGYADENGWSSALVPYQGEEANQTLFITSDFWKMPNWQSFIGTHVIQARIHAFTLLTDGCEKSCFEVNLFDEKTQRYYDPNRPYPPFFNPNVKGLYQLYKEGKSDAEINHLWAQFLEGGTPTLTRETDDKTLILGLQTELFLTKSPSL